MPQDSLNSLGPDLIILRGSLPVHLTCLYPIFFGILLPGGHGHIQNDQNYITHEDSYFRMDKPTSGHPDTNKYLNR